MDIRNRIVKLEQIEAAELVDHDGNPRSHPVVQRNYLKSMLEEVGIAGALVAYYSEKRDGKLTLIDGHMRKAEHNGKWPVLITDLTDEEADKMLALGDFIGSYAEIDQAQMAKLIGEMDLAGADLRILLDDLAGNEDPFVEESKKEDDKTQPIHPDMELRPFEHYDYVLLLCRNSMDWNYLFHKLGLEKVNSAVPGAKNPKVGLGRAIDARRVIELIKKASEASA